MSSSVPKTRRQRLTDYTTQQTSLLLPLAFGEKSEANYELDVIK